MDDDFDKLVVKKIKKKVIEEFDFDFEVLEKKKVLFVKKKKKKKKKLVSEDSDDEFEEESFLILLLKKNKRKFRDKKCLNKKRDLSRSRLSGCL